MGSAKWLVKVATHEVEKSMKYLDIGKKIKRDVRRHFHEDISVS